MTESTGKRVLPVPAFPLTTSKALLDGAPDNETQIDDQPLRMRKSRSIYPGDRTDLVFAFIIQWKLEHDGNSPTLREIMEGCNIGSTSTATYHRDKLVRARMIRLIGKKRDGRRIEVIGGKWSYTKP